MAVVASIELAGRFRVAVDRPVVWDRLDDAEGAHSAFDEPAAKPHEQDGAEHTVAPRASRWVPRGSGDSALPPCSTVGLGPRPRQPSRLRVAEKSSGCSHTIINLWYLVRVLFCCSQHRSCHQTELCQK